MPEQAARIACAVGPTASGKSDVAQQLALILDGEVVSADSMQVYRGMDIGTGKVPVAERIVPHHGLDLVDPDEPYSAALFQAYARRAFSEIGERIHVPILAGGTGFYVRAAIDDYDFPEGEQVGNPVRDRYNALLSERGAQAVWDELAAQDPESAARVHPHDAKRVIRALELAACGCSYAEQLDALHSIEQAVPAQMFGLHVEREALYERINRRVDAMREAGLVGEVENLLARGFKESLTAPQAIGYKEIVSALEGRITLDEAFEDIKRATRRYAKRQMTWFRRDGRIRWLDADDGDAVRIADEAARIYGR